MTSNQNFFFSHIQATHEGDDNGVCPLIRFVSKTNAPSVRISRFRRCSDYSGLTIVQTIFGKLSLTYIRISNGVKLHNVFL